jgi:ATP-dependent DNA helicase RecG
MEHITQKTELSKIFRLVDSQKDALKKLRIKTVLDLLYYFPSRYGNVAEIKNISSFQKGDYISLYGKIEKLKMSKAHVSKMTMAEGEISDSSGSKMKVVWFNQPYIAKMLKDGDLVKLSGQVSDKKGRMYLSNPEYEVIKEIPISVGDSLWGETSNNLDKFGFPVYPESKGITSKWIYHAIDKIFRSGIIEELEDTIPKEILEKYNLPGLRTALVWIHTPHKQSDAEAARKRFAFEEVFFIQLQKMKERKNNHSKKSFILHTEDKEIEGFIKRFPFEATEAQIRAIAESVKDMKSGRPMSRLLEGDVGSGKTAVAASLVYASIMSSPTSNKYAHLQTAYMAPTEILAKQHFESFIKYFAYTGVSVGLITGSGCQKFPSKIRPTEATSISKSQLLKWVESGDIPIVIGTHALISKNVKFKNLAFVIIDEQHRFGTEQRQKLTRKDDFAPHLLSMTATPIPRTLALTIFGDLDLTLLDQMPSGRKPVITEIVLPHDRENTYEKIREELKAGRQVYIICPRIDEPDPTKEMAILAKSVKAEAERLNKYVFPEFVIDIMHSKMPPKEKDDAMEGFMNGSTQILVSTSVVEVGVNNPNATVILIEGGERFGLAQLHQLRGRVIRGTHQAYCYVFTESNSQKTAERLKALKTAKNGFELAEFDLAQRGSGKLYGEKQWGISDIGMEAIKNLKMVEAARNEAEHIIDIDPELVSYHKLREKIEMRKEIHFE